MFEKGRARSEKVEIELHRWFGPKFVRKARAMLSYREGRNYKVVFTYEFYHSRSCSGSPAMELVYDAKLCYGRVFRADGATVVATPVQEKLELLGAGLLGTAKEIKFVRAESALSMKYGSMVALALGQAETIGSDVLTSYNIYKNGNV